MSDKIDFTSKRLRRKGSTFYIQKVYNTDGGYKL